MLTTYRSQCSASTAANVLQINVDVQRNKLEKVKLSRQHLQRSTGRCDNAEKLAKFNESGITFQREVAVLLYQNNTM